MTICVILGLDPGIHNNWIYMLRNTHIWLPAYLQQCCTPQHASIAEPRHIIFTIADHFEPRLNGASKQEELERVDTWIKKFSALRAPHADAHGHQPRYTFFYPIDEYTPECLDKIATFCRTGGGEVEIHLHHDHDTAASLTEKLEYAKRTYRDHGLLSTNPLTKEIHYGFIHGNWALDNSRPDGRWCGVNTELTVLKNTGCYADFTLPSAPSATQTRKINSIYYAHDTPQPKSHNTGTDVQVGKAASGDLMLIQGPLSLNWSRRKWGFIPRIENGDLLYSNPVTAARVNLWAQRHIHVKGRPEWTFIKVHTHGARAEHLQQDFFDNMDFMLHYLEKYYNDTTRFQLHYMTAREMYNVVKAAEAGEEGNPHDFRDYHLKTRIHKS